MYSKKKDDSRCPPDPISINRTGILLSPPNRRHNAPITCVFQVDAGHDRVVKIDFLSVTLTVDADCSESRITLQYAAPGTGTALDEFCTMQRHSWLSANQQVTLTFEASGNSQLDEGFSARINFIEKTIARKSMTSLVTNGSKCSDIKLTAPSGIFQSPNYPDKYDNDLDCYWIITVASGQIELHFDEFDVEPETSCSYDSLTVYDGRSMTSSMLGSYCNAIQPQTIISSGRSLTVHFVTDNSVNQKGFSLRYTLYNGIKQAQEVQCGIPLVPRPASKLRGPIESTPGSSPWHVSIRRDGKHICSGAIISGAWILTSAHCVACSSIYTVLPVGHLFNSCSKETLVKQIHKHPNYDPDSREYDVALLLLTSPVSFGKDVVPVCLPTHRIPVYHVCSVSSWAVGYDHSNPLRINNFPVLPSPMCNSTTWYDGRIKDDMLCAGFPEPVVRSCPFLKDSGSPLMCLYDDQWVLGGVLSWSEQCGAKNRPTVFTDVYAELVWIKSMISGSCGAASVNPLFGHMFNSEPAVPHSWPWHVRILRHGSFVCAGTIIGDRWVLTSAHCGKSLDLIVIAGSYRRSRRGYNEQIRQVVNVTVHPGYCNKSLKHDLAVLETRCSFHMGDAVWPACLPRQSAPQNQMCVVTGWRRTLNGENPDSIDILEQALLPLMTSKQCRNQTWNSEAISDGMLCAGFPEGTKQGCKGDDGGPLVCQRDGLWHLTGVTSFGPTTCNIAGLPTVFSDVHRAVPWITSIIGEPYEIGAAVPKTEVTCSQKPIQRSDAVDEADEDEVVNTDLSGQKGCRCHTRPRIISGSNGTIQSANFPFAYPDFVTCKWIINAPELPVKLTFKTFGIEPSPNCTYDHLKIITGRGVHSVLCGATVPQPLYVHAKSFR
ncbi:hypothetical protein CAPTEDRAFT_201465, partial [Capitella teleta]